MNTGQQILFFAATIILNLFLLNLLISIVTDVHDNIVLQIQAIDGRIKAKLMLEVELIFEKWNRDVNAPKHIVFLSYVND